MPTTIKVLKRGTVCKDKATGCEGTIFHWLLDTGCRVDYLFQPRAINPETGHPVDRICLEETRLEFPENSHEEVELPTEILGSMVTHTATGLKGMVVGFIMHPNGCFHLCIQPPGLLANSNSTIKRIELDMRECKGKMIPRFTEEEKRESEKTNPSPTGNVFGDKYSPTSGIV